MTKGLDPIHAARESLELGRPDAVERAEHAVDTADRAPQRSAGGARPGRDDRSEARRILAGALLAADRIDEAARCAYEATRIAHAARSVRQEALAELARAEVFAAQGELLDALRHASRARKLAHKDGHRPTLLLACGEVASLLSRVGDDERARELFDEALRGGASELSPRSLARVTMLEGAAHYAAGRSARALAAADRAEALVAGSASAAFRLEVSLLRARVWLDLGDADRARAALGAAPEDSALSVASRAQLEATRIALSIADNDRPERTEELITRSAALAPLGRPARLALERARASFYFARGRADDAERVAVGIAAAASKGGMRQEAAHALSIAAKTGSPDAWLLRWLGALGLSTAGTSGRGEHEALAALCGEPEPIGQLARNGLAVARARLVENAPEDSRAAYQRMLRQIEARVLALRQSRRAGAEVALDEALLRAKEAANIAGSSPPLLKAIATVARAARSDASVVLTGETGCGKELFARFVHRISGRASGPFVAINCAAIAEPLLEGELFGHERGAFTGAERARRGLFVEAEGGTLFLDEVGEMSPAMQVKLLRVLEDREVRAVGGNRSRKVDVRVVAATHRDLSAMVAAGRFREDLYYRLAAITVRVPALRERPEDVPTIARALLARDPATQHHRFDVPALAALAAHPWPGNVRELANVIRVAAAMCEGTVIGGPDIERAIGSGASRLETHGTRALEETTLAALRARHRAEIRELVGRALAGADGNKLRAARALGVSRQGLYRVLAETS